MLDGRALTILVEVDRCGSFSAASETLSMTQPAVSRQVSGLERRLGVQLFHRLPRGVRATAAGKLAVDAARDVLDRTRSIERRLAAFGALDVGRVRLAAYSSANTAFMPETIRLATATYPGIRFSLLRCESAEAFGAIKDGHLDLAVITDWDLRADAKATNTGFELTALIDEQLHIALPANHRLARATRVRLSDLRDEVWIEGAHPDCLGPIHQLTEALGAPPTIGFTCDDWNGKQALVAAGAGITLVPTLARPALRPDIVLRPVIPALPTRGVYVLAAEETNRSPAVSATLALLREVASHIS